MRRTRAVLLGGSCLWLCGCAQVLGVNDYSNSSSSASFASLAPFLTSEKCQHCIATNCSQELLNCGPETACGQWIEKMRDKGFGPLADYNRRFLSPLADGARAWNSDGGLDPLAPLNDLMSCLRRLNDYQGAGCLDRCDLGRDFSCVDHFQWSPTQAGEKDIRLRLLDPEGSPLSGWPAQYCGTATCETPVDEEMTDDRGFAALSIQVRDDPPFRYLLVAGGARSYPFMYPMPAGPIRLGLNLEEMAASKASVDAELSGLGTTFDKASSEVWVFPRDCLGNPARHVTVSVLTPSAGAWSWCSELDCPPAYPGSTGSAEVGQRDLSLGPRAIITAVPPHATWVVVRDTSTGAPVAMQKFDARAGTIHALVLYPASASEFEDLATLPPAP